MLCIRVPPNNYMYTNSYRSKYKDTADRHKKYNGNIIKLVYYLTIKVAIFVNDVI